jgi:hypothetical protein
MALSLLQQSSLAQDGNFVDRVQQALVAAAVSIANEVANEVQQIAITGTATAGTFTLSYAGSTTAAIAFNATAATVQAAVQALASVGAGNVVCTGGPLPATPVVVTFTGALGALPLNLLSLGTNSLTGTAPAPAFTRVSAGVSFVSHAARAALAKLILNNPGGYAALFATSVAAGAAVQADYALTNGVWALAVAESVADADMATRVSAVWNGYV